MRALGLERWVETLEVAPAQMRSIRALADGADRALFADEALAADGWRRDADGHWHGALTAAACEGPVTDVVVLAQARADVDRGLAPTPEETLAPGEWTSLLGEDAPRGDGPPPPDLGTCTGPTAEALDAASARFAELCEAWADARQPDGTFVTAAGEVVTPTRSGSRHGRGLSSPSGWRRRWRRRGASGERPVAGERTRRPLRPRLVRLPGTASTDGCCVAWGGPCGKQRPSRACAHPPPVSTYPLTGETFQ